MRLLQPPLLSIVIRSIKLTTPHKKMQRRPKLGYKCSINGNTLHIVLTDKRDILSEKKKSYLNIPSRGMR